MPDANNPSGALPGNPRYGLSVDELAAYYRTKSPTWIVRGMLKPDGGVEARAAALDPHLIYLRASRDQIRFAGPLLADDGERPRGALTLLDAPDRAAAEAWLARASARETLGDFSGALRNQQRAASLSPASPAVILHRARFFLRRGLLAEAKKYLERLASPPEELRLKLRERAGALDELKDGAGKDALLRLGGCDWTAAEKPLQAALENTRRTDPARAADLARLLLAKNPSSGDALRFLIRHTTDPQLIIPRLHYLGRLSRADPGNAGLREELATLRRLLLGS